MSLIFESVSAGLAALFFALLQRSPKRLLILTGILGGTGWLVYSVVKSEAAAYFVATLLICIIAETAARIKKTPASVIIIPSIIPIVPGVQLYNTMRFFAEGEFNAGLERGVSTFIYVFGMAAAIMLSTIIGKRLIAPIAKKIEKSINKKAF